MKKRGRKGGCPVFSPSRPGNPNFVAGYSASGTKRTVCEIPGRLNRDDENETTPPGGVRLSHPLNTTITQNKNSVNNAVHVGRCRSAVILPRSIAAEAADSLHCNRRADTAIASDFVFTELRSTLERR